MSFHINPSRLVHKFGVEVKVWSAEQFNEQAYPGAQTSQFDINNLSEDKADKLNEPVVPASSHLAQLLSQLNGGGEVQGDLLWLSLNQYPIKSVVFVPSQGGYYQVSNGSSYAGHTKPPFYEYELKGVDQDGTNTFEDATNSGSIPDNLYPESGSERTI